MVNGIRYILNRFKHYYCLGELNAKWRAQNSHNYTNIARRCDFSHVKVGNYTYGPLNIHDFKSDNSLSIGNFCSIADDVHFFLAGGHELNRISTYPFKKNIFDGNPESISKGNIVIEDDVWIGSGVFILSGVTVRKGSVIAAGSVVTKDIPQYVIVAGVPARVIKKRFADDVSELLMNFDYSQIDKKTIKANIDLLYESIDDKVLSVISGMLSSLQEGGKKSD